MIDSVFGTGKNYYPQVILEEFKYIVKEKKIPIYVTGHIGISSDCDRENSDEKNIDEENSDEKNTDKENFGEEN